MVLERLDVPIVLAPMAGGPSTPALAAAVAGAGGLGFLASGYLSAARTREQLAEARRLTSGPVGVNVFVPGDAAPERESLERYLERLRAWAGGVGAELGEPVRDDDDWGAKVDLLAREAVPVVSFTFGCPPPDVIERLQGAGSEVWVTVTAVDEASEAAGAGADALVVQGAEAGGHRGSFADRPDLPVDGLLPLLQTIAAKVPMPLVAAGGIATGPAVAAVLCAGAAAAQLGTAFMLCPEAGTSPAHREALRSPRSTALTRAFTGRLARGIRNDFMDRHSEGAPIAYPEVHHVTAPLRRAAREAGDADRINLWAGEAHELAEPLPAAEVVARLARGARDASARVARRLAASSR
ncbi:MAG TPA: nitronate monooxygenase [Solirubrobacteraceae bacterium]|jgi:nitronate monooxygenase|nr:nitronate monooxygenase [Solirubrobacteraceae bacterium]